MNCTAVTKLQFSYSARSTASSISAPTVQAQIGNPSAIEISLLRITQDVAVFGLGCVGVQVKRVKLPRIS